MALLLLELWIYLISTIMISVYDIEVDNTAIRNNLKRLQSQTFKLLPMREEGEDCKKPLETIILELLGMQGLFSTLEPLVTLICKLQGLKEIDGDENFMLYRRTIFECCGLLDKVAECFQFLKRWLLWKIQQKSI